MRSPSDAARWLGCDDLAGYAIAAGTQVGPARSVNEDLAAADARLGLVAVLDGFGGIANGVVASGTAYDALLEAVRDRVGDPGLRLTSALAAASAAVAVAATAERCLTGMGATVAAALLAPGGATIAHVGDVRAYLLRGARLAPLTVDHDVRRACAEAGQPPPVLTPALRHVVTRCLGLASAGPDLTRTALEAGDRLILCSDGVHDLLDDATLAALVAASDLRDAVERVLDAADRPGGENATIAIVAAERAP